MGVRGGRRRIRAGGECVEPADVRCLPTFLMAIAQLAVVLNAGYRVGAAETHTMFDLAQTEFPRKSNTCAGSSRVAFFSPRWPAWH